MWTLEKNLQEVLDSIAIPRLVDVLKKWSWYLWLRKEDQQFIKDKFAYFKTKSWKKELVMQWTR